MSKQSGGRRRGTEKQKALRDEAEAAVTHRIFHTLGAEAADRWLAALGLPASPRWFVEIGLTGDGDSRFDLNIYQEEWGFSFSQAGVTSWIRVTDVAFVHGRDDFRLLAETPDLLGIAGLLAAVERDHGIEWRRPAATVRTNVANAEPIVRDWLLQPLPVVSVKQTIEL